MPVRIHGGPAQQPVRYLFVDAAHLRPNFVDVTQRWFGHDVTLDVGLLRILFTATKVFYYDSIDDLQRQGETSEAFDARVKAQEAALRDINAIPNTHVRYGSITGRDRRKRRQKEVDILIAVDMMNHAVRQNMDHAVLLTGDRDFAPLVETLVQFGLIVEVAGDFRFTSEVLREAADNFRPLALNEYSQLVDGFERRQMPGFPEFSGTHDPYPPSITGVASGPVGREAGRVVVVRNGEYRVELASRQGVRDITVPDRDALARVKLYLQLQYGDVDWLDQYVAGLAS